MTNSEFLDYYHKGDYIYENVIRVNLDYPDEAIDYFLSNNLIKEDKFYRCPECYHSMPVFKDDGLGNKVNEFVCYSCGKIWNRDNLIEKRIFRKV